jgi:hypothetical protein
MLYFPDLFKGATFFSACRSTSSREEIHFTEPHGGGVGGLSRRETCASLSMEETPACKYRCTGYLKKQ